MQLQWWPTLSSLRMHLYFRRISPRSGVNIDQHYPPLPPKKKTALRVTSFLVLLKWYKMIICTRCWNIRGKEIRKTARVLHFNQITKLLLYLTKVMRFDFKQNERFKLKKYDPARTRTWNLLIRSQTPYPLGHEADIGFYCFLTIICFRRMFSTFASADVMKSWG